MANVRTATAPINTSTATTTDTTPSATSNLSIGSIATINGVTIGILDLVSDSRCPVDVQCIQAGTVSVRVSIGSFNKDFTFTLGQPQVVSNATVTLASVAPAQKYAKQTLSPSDYRFTFTVVPKGAANTGPQACTMEAKLCSDGSAVGRTGPNCEFAACPTYNSGIRGSVLLGPTCPVQRIPPDPACADKPYATSVTVYRTGSQIPLIIGSSDTTGAFEFSLPPGSYMLITGSSTTLPRCGEIIVDVTKNTYVTTKVSCDTGIR